MCVCVCVCVCVFVYFGIQVPSLGSYYNKDVLANLPVNILFIQGS